MKKSILTAVVCVGLVSTMAFARGGHGHNNKLNTSSTTVTSSNTYTGSVVNNTPVYSLSEEMKDDLVFMYQEEKVARDVYRKLGDIWGERVFLNIQNAEQRHMDSIRGLLEKYNIPVPVIDDTEGQFENGELQGLYDMLVAQGENSLIDALNVGVLVEETDIADLQARMGGVPDDVQAVYESLLNGSYNHLRAFNRVLDNGTVSSGRRGRR